MFSSDNAAFNLYDEVSVTNSQTPSAGTGDLGAPLSAYRTPRARRATGNDVYAEVGDASFSSSSQLPFTPDPELRLGLQRKDTDSGLYSLPSEKRAIIHCNEGPYATAFEGPYATAYATSNIALGSVGREKKPPVPNTSTLSPSQIEALYAKPNKVKRQPKQSQDQPPELPPARQISIKDNSGDISRTNDSSHNVSRETIETNV